METKFISSDEQRAYLLMKHLELYIGKTDFENLIVIEVNPEYDRSGVRTRPRLEIARQLSKDTKNIIILVDMDTFDLDKIGLFTGLISLPNVGFVSSLRLGDLPEKYEEIYARNKVNPDITAHELFELEQLGYEIMQLQSSLIRINSTYQYAGSEAANEWLEKARSIGFSGSDQEVANQIRIWNPVSAGYFENKALDGIFVDSAGILFDERGSFITEARDAITQMAQKENKSVFVMFDWGFSIESDLKRNDVSWKSFSPYMVKGAILECIVSKNPQVELFKKYQISTSDFRNWPDI